MLSKISQHVGTMTRAGLFYRSLGPCLIHFAPLLQRDIVVNRYMYTVNLLTMNRFPSIHPKKLIRNSAVWTISKIKIGKRGSLLLV